MAGEIYVTEDGSFTMDPSFAVGMVQGNSVTPYSPTATAGGMQMPDGSQQVMTPPPVQQYVPPEPVERVVFDARGNPIARPSGWSDPNGAPAQAPAMSLMAEPEPEQPPAPAAQPAPQPRRSPAPQAPRISPTARKLAAAQAQEDADWAAYDQINQQAKQRVSDAEMDAMMAAEERAMLGERRAQIADDAQKRLQSVEAQHAADVQREQAQIDKLTGEIRAATPRDRRTKGQRVASAIAIALGGLGQAYQARAGINAPNAALQLVNESIDRDFEQQRAAMNALRDEKAAKETRLGRLESALGDKRQAVYAWRAAELDDYADEARQLEAKYAGTMQARAYADAAAQLEAESAKLKLSTSTTRTNMRMAEQSRAEAAAAAGKRGADPLALRMQLAKVREAEANALKAENEAGGKPDAKSQEKIQAQDAMIETLDRIAALRSQNPNLRAVPGTDAYNKLQSLQAQFIVDYKSAKNLGALDKGTMEIADAMLGDATSWTGGTDAKIKTLRQTAVGERNKARGTDASKLAAAANEEEL